MTGTKAAGAARCRRKFLRFFSKGFRDELPRLVQGSDEYHWPVAGRT